MKDPDITHKLRDVFGPAYVSWEWHPEHENTVVILLSRRPKGEERKQIANWLFDATAKTGFDRVYDDVIITKDDVVRSRDAWVRTVFRKAV
jgi:hypothetical protein